VLGNKMPPAVMVAAVVQDPSEDVEMHVGRGGGTYDQSSGVLELQYTRNDDWKDVDPNYYDEVFDDTTMRFVEIEHLLMALSRSRIGYSPDHWRLVLAEALDAHEL
jgi:hypothetical protein